MKNIRDKNSFTLIELMLTSIILSVGLIFIMRSFVIALEAVRRVENVKAISAALEEKMEEVKEKSKEEGGILKGDYSGKIAAQEGEPYVWSLKATPSAADELLNEVTLTVSRIYGRKEEKIFATTYLAGRSE